MNEYRAGLWIVPFCLLSMLYSLLYRYQFFVVLLYYALVKGVFVLDKNYLENLVTKHQSTTMDDSNETGIASRSMVIGIYLIHPFI